MGRLREQYKIPEFLEARLALDGYYSSLNSLAWLLKRRSCSDQEKQVAVEKVHESRSRLIVAVYALGLLDGVEQS